MEKTSQGSSKEVRKEEPLKLLTSHNFQPWLIEQRASIAFTTYQIGKFMMIGTNSDGRLHATERTFNRCMGIGGNDQTLWLSSIYQFWRFENSLLPGQAYEGYDRVYLPQIAYTTGNLSTHDVAMDKSGHPVFINTLFSCLATVSETHSFKPLWTPPFISSLAPEDRCHLNGLAMMEGEPAYITAVSKSDTAGGWRDQRTDGGIIMDIRSNEIICEGLSMPHSPRWYKDRLWVLEAGTGYLGYVDKEQGRFEQVCFCPGFLRGLNFIGDYALVGTSAIRKSSSFQGLELENQLKQRNLEPYCGIQVINLSTGRAEHWIKMEGLIDELYDVMALPKVIRPLIIGTKKDDIKNMISIEL